MTLILTIFLLLKIVPGNDPSGEASQTSIFEMGEPSLAGALTVSSQPADQTDCKGNKVTFSVDTQGGAGTIHYLWKRKRPADAAFVAFGAKDSTKLPVYNIGTGSEAPDKTLYQVAVSDQDTETTSLPALLTVNQIIGISPVGVAVYTINEGENLSFKVLSSGNPPSAIQWIKKYGSNDWRDVTDNSIVSGSTSDQLKFTKISVRDSGIYKVRVTFPTRNNTQCTETSTTIRTIHVKAVVDIDPPLFVNLSNRNMTVCPDNLEQAEWNEIQRDILPERAKFYRLHKHTFQFDLSASNFQDNITPISDLVLHWGIFSATSPYGPVLDEAATTLDDSSGQISLHPENIDLEGVTSGNKTYRIIFWLEDRAGNLTPDTLRHIVTLTVAARPEIVSNF